MIKYGITNIRAGNYPCPICAISQEREDHACMIAKKYTKRADLTELSYTLLVDINKRNAKIRKCVLSGGKRIIKPSSRMMNTTKERITRIQY